MKKISLAILSLSVLALNACGPKKSACTYSTDPKDIQLEWTAFKFTEKTPVKGKFNKAEVKGKTQAGSLAELVTGLHIDIDGASVETNDPGRNATIQQFFFEKFNPPFHIHAMATKLEGDDQKGTMAINLSMSGSAKDVPFAYTVGADGVLTAQASIDMLEFGLQAPYDSIHKACEDKHTGKDGVSKTWTQVDLLLTGKFKKECK